MRDLFGRYVGEDVAGEALGAAPKLGGGNATSRFCSWIWSAPRNWPRPPAEVVQLLNEFFRVVVARLCSEFVNKGSRRRRAGHLRCAIRHPDGAGAALSAARRNHDELIPVLGSRSSASACRPEGHRQPHIGVSPLQYTVIGGPVNGADRLTELAKRSRMATFWRQRSRSVAPLDAKHCVGMLAGG